MSARWIIPNATTFHVSTAGDDGNDGLSSTNPLKTFAKLESILFGGMVDFGGQTVTAQIDSGSGNYTESLAVSPWTGSGALIFDAGGKTINYAGVASVDGAINVSGGALPGPLTIQNGTFSSSTGASTLLCSTLLVQSSSIVIIGTSVTFGAAGFAQINTANGGAVVRLINSFSLSGNAPYFIFGNLGEIANFAIPITITATGAITYSGSVVNASTGSLVVLGALAGRKVTWGNPGNFTGVRFNADSNGIVNTQGGGDNFIPGTIAGTKSTGGQYF